MDNDRLRDAEQRAIAYRLELEALLRYVERILERAHVTTTPAAVQRAREALGYTAPLGGERREE